jgi:hypothetical protein
VSATVGVGGYEASVSSNGTSFGSVNFIWGAGSASGFYSRLVAAGSTFYAFVPVLTSQFVPSAVEYLSSSDGVTWCCNPPQSLAQFTPPSNQSPNGTIYYAPLLQAQGYLNGLWTVVFQIDNGGFNNAYICTSSRGCGLVNAAADDEFLVGTSVSGDGGYWVNYYAYSSLNNRQLPLITQAVYFPSGQGPIGRTIDSGIDPSDWQPTAGACPSTCYSAGDFNNIASNTSLVASTPDVSEDVFGDPVLYQNFLQDPQAPATPGTFTPNFIPYPMGADLLPIGRPLPLNAQGEQVLPPESAGVSPFNRHGKTKR